MQQERDHLLAEVENLSSNSDGQTQKSEDIHAQKLKSLEAQVGNFITSRIKFIFCQSPLTKILINCKNLFKIHEC